MPESSCVHRAGGGPLVVSKNGIDHCARLDTTPAMDLAQDEHFS
jgi:hypothetical protein